MQRIRINENHIQYWIEHDIISLGDVALGMEVTMSKILDNVHKYKISKTSDGRWTTRVKDLTKPDGTRMIRRNSKTDLYAFLIDFYGLIPEKCVKQTFGEVFTEWVEYKRAFTRANYKPLSTLTIERYENDYKKYIKGTELESAPIDIDNMTLEQFIIRIVSSKQMRPSAFGNLYGYITQMYRYAVRKRYVTADPMVFIDKDRLKGFCYVDDPKTDEERIIPSEQLSAFVTILNKHISDDPSYMPAYAVMLALYTGLRVGELVALKWKCIDHDFIQVEYSEHKVRENGKTTLIVGEPKNRKHRTIPLTQDIETLLEAIKEISVNEEWVFADDKGRISADSVSGACKRYSHEARIPRVSIHRIRRTVSSYLNTMLPREAVSAMLGHLTTTNERFYDYDISEKSEKINALSAVSRKVTDFKSYRMNIKIAEAK